MSADAKITGRATPFHCQQCGAVIGMMVVRSHVRRLLLFASGSAQVMVEIKGDAAVYCTTCGAERKWWEDRKQAILSRFEMDEEERYK